jgi:hypothetical protein
MAQWIHDLLAQQQLLDGQLLLLAAQGARHFGHHKDVVGHKTRAQRSAHRAVDARAQGIMEHAAGAQHDKQRQVAFTAQVLQVHHQAAEHLTVMVAPQQPRGAPNLHKPIA